MNEPFNSQTPHFLTKVKTYCAKVLPLVFDNSLSYYEFLGKVCHKLNECIDALNAQNLNIIEFTHMVQLEMENFEKYIDSRVTEFENELKTEWAQYKEEINQAFDDFKTQIETEWAAEKALNEKFRNDLLNEFNSFKNEITAQQERFENQIKADFNTYKETVNAEIEQFEQATNADLSAFKNTMQTQQNEFEDHMVELFNNFKTTEKQARTDFESNFQQLFEQWKIDTLHALNEGITGWESDAQAELTNYINEKLVAFNTSLNNATTHLNDKIEHETSNREKADKNLQRQINQLTPIGTIKADTPDSNGYSQLYTVDPDTEERNNIIPTTNISTIYGDDADDYTGKTQLYKIDPVTKDKVNILPVVKGTTVKIRPLYLESNTAECNLDFVIGGSGHISYKMVLNNSNGINTNGITDLGTIIKVSLSNFKIRPTQNTDPKTLIQNNQLTYSFYTDYFSTMAQNLFFKGNPSIIFTNARINDNYFKCDAKLICYSGSSSTFNFSDVFLTINFNELLAGIDD